MPVLDGSAHYIVPGLQAMFPALCAELEQTLSHLCRRKLVHDALIASGKSHDTSRQRREISARQLKNALVECQICRNQSKAEEKSQICWHGMRMQSFVMRKRQQDGYEPVSVWIAHERTPCGCAHQMGQRLDCDGDSCNLVCADARFAANLGSQGSVTNSHGTNKS